LNNETKSVKPSDNDEIENDDEAQLDIDNEQQNIVSSSTSRKADDIEDDNRPIPLRANNDNYRNVNREQFRQKRKTNRREQRLDNGEEIRDDDNEQVRKRNVV
jgi:hypothetical protein